MDSAREKKIVKKMKRRIYEPKVHSIYESELARSDKADALRDDEPLQTPRVKRIECEMLSSVCADEQVLCLGESMEPFKTSSSSSSSSSISSSSSSPALSLPRASIKLKRRKELVARPVLDMYDLDSSDLDDDLIDEADMPLMSREREDSTPLFEHSSKVEKIMRVRHRSIQKGFVRNRPSSRWYDRWGSYTPKNSKRDVVATPVPVSKYGSEQREKDVNSQSPQPLEFSYFCRIPAPCRALFISFLGMDVFEFDKAMTSKAERKELMKAYRGTVIRGLLFKYRLGAIPGKKWSTEVQALYKEDICKPLHACLNKWAKKRAVIIRDFVLNIPDSPSENILTVLMNSMRFSMIKLILMHCDNISAFEPSSVTHPGSPLSMLVYHGDTELVRLMCKKSHMVKTRKDERGCTPLHTVASTFKDPDMARALIEAGINTEAICERDGETAMFAAATAGNIVMLKVMHEMGANINALNRYNHSPLDRACRIVKEGHTMSSRDFLLSIKAKSGRAVLKARRQGRSA